MIDKTTATDAVPTQFGSAPAGLWEHMRWPVGLLRVCRLVLVAGSGTCLADPWPMVPIYLAFAGVAWALSADLDHRFRPVRVVERLTAHRPASFALLSPTELYRLYDVAGRLLYVGVGWSSLVRCRRHAARHGWWCDVASVHCQRYPFRGQALAVEQYVIENERPLHNTARGALIDQAWSHGWTQPESVALRLDDIERIER